MLKLFGESFTCGRARFSDHHTDSIEPSAKIYVRLRLGTLETLISAQLDTGAAWSVLSPALANAADVVVEGGQPAVMSTRLGVKRGLLVRIPLLLLADEGESLATEGTFFIPSDWPKNFTFLGYSGLLDSIRFAIDPAANDFYFGPSGGRR